MGPTIAAHVDHLRYGLSVLNRWAAGEEAPWQGADWTASWKNHVVSDAQRRVLLDQVRRESDAWQTALATPREATPPEIRWVVGSIAHLAYHLGAIRQIDRAT
ncbi:MAG TPA: hypothetical protein VK636_03525, partial [Gemmatimonadaceae bacterium]|nr:hypothetical protein [Gemmatimonadaceae bacterium]